MTKKCRAKRREIDSTEMAKKELLEEIPTIRPGDRVLRRRRKPRGILRTISQNVSRFFKGTVSK
ncbi:MAG: hypothetical protein E3J75_00430 [Dehalococcoidia bacterium]|nr:MAG: hypothetical protein E3J75_00430 [Dehalococcoidia bacterium]